MGSIMDSSARTINLYYLFIFVRSLSFLWPVWVLLLNDRGYDIFIITLLDVIFFVTMALTEIPTGTVADKISRKLSLLVGVLLYSIGIIIFALASDLWSTIVAYIIWATGMTFWSGADQAFLYDSLKHFSMEEDYQRVYGQSLFLGGVATALASIIGGLLGSFDLRLPVLLTAVASVGSGIILIFIPEKWPTEGMAKTKYARHVLETIRIVKDSRIVGLLFVFSTLFAIMGIIEFVFRQLYLRTELGVSVFLIGVLYAIAISLNALGAKSSSRFNEILGDKLFLWTQAAIIGISFFFLGLAIPLISVSFLLLYSCYGSTFEPLLNCP
ncbi:MAG: MFS transporter [Candidatus Heimdallarchaeota archaeon]